MTARKADVDVVAAKALLALHAAIDVAAFWKAVQRVINAGMPDSVIGLTLQHSPVLPLISKWTEPIADGFCHAKPIQNYLRAHPRSRFVRISDIFPIRSKLLRSEFYRKYMARARCEHAIGLFFWDARRLIGVVIVMRTARQGDLSEGEMKSLRNFYPQFQTALNRLRSLEREHSARMVFEELLGRLPLPTILLRWNLKIVYRNKAALEFCALWKQGPEMTRMMKLIAPVPLEILDGCRSLKERWKAGSRGHELRPVVYEEMVRHPKMPDLRAKVSMQELHSAGVARPHFLIECEERKRARERGTHLPQLARLSQREQQVARLVCDGFSNQEIADKAAVSVAMVKKHLHAMFRKLEVPSRSRLIALMR